MLKQRTFARPAFATKPRSGHATQALTASWQALTASWNDGGGQKCYLGMMDSKFTLADLEQRVSDRAKASAEASYTRKLLDKGVAQCAKKFGEEAVEAVLAAVGEDRERVVAEAADVFYHLLVMLHARGVKLAEVEALLESRTKKSGLEEKASR
jgi:phosphoribosyl-ATP pyrophosphohydrolase